MKLYLLRHAEAGEAASDPERPLTARGRATSVELGKFIRNRRGVSIEKILHSPYLRAVETAELVAESAQLLEVPRRAIEGITPMDEPETIVPLLEQSPDNLLLVGHNPHLSMLISRLLARSETAISVAFKKTALACLERYDYPSPNGNPACQWTLRWFLTPNFLD